MILDREYLAILYVVIAETIMIFWLSIWMHDLKSEGIIAPHVEMEAIGRIHAMKIWIA
jgi:hypothetical protein